MGPSVTMVDGLAAQLGDRSACDCFALATSRLMAALGIWRTWPWRGGRPRIDREIRALIVRMSRENFLWGAPRIHGELIDVSQATVSRYMPRRSYPPTQSWRTFLRNQVLGIGIVGLGEAGRISDQLLALVRGWSEWVVQCATKLRNGISCSLIEPPRTLHPSRPSRSSNGTDRCAIHGGYLPVRPRRTAQGGDRWTMAGRRLSPYRSRASPRLKLPANGTFLPCQPRRAMSAFG
jgi:hypothetical protein